MKIFTMFVAWALAIPIVALGATGSGATSPSNSADGISLTRDELHFQRICMAGNDVCRYVDIHLFSAREVEVQALTYVRLNDVTQVSAFNKMMAEREKTDPTSLTTKRSVSKYDPVSKKWQTVAGWRGCAGCLNVERTLRRPGTHWVRLFTIGNRTIRPNSYLVKTVTVGRYQHTYVKVRASAAEGVAIYADERLDSTHMPAPIRRPDGAFVALMRSDWVKSTLPDYITISTMPSYSAVARTYLDKEQSIISRPNGLPVFTGSNTHAVINKVVKYISSLKLHGQADTFGAFPHRGVDEILKGKSADCKDYATLVIAALHKSGIPAYATLFNQSGLAPLSYTVPSHWSNHVIVYVPKIKRFIDMTAVIGSRGKIGWTKSASLYKGDIALSTMSGTFVLIY